MVDEVGIGLERLGDVGQRAERDEHDIVGVGDRLGEQLGRGGVAEIRRVGQIDAAQRVGGSRATAPAPRCRLSAVCFAHTRPGCRVTPIRSSMAAMFSAATGQCAIPVPDTVIASDLDVGLFEQVHDRFDVVERAVVVDNDLRHVGAAAAAPAGERSQHHADDHPMTHRHR